MSDSQFSPISDSERDRLRGLIAKRADAYIESGSSPAPADWLEVDFGDTGEISLDELDGDSIFADVAARESALSTQNVLMTGLIARAHEVIRRFVRNPTDLGDLNRLALELGCFLSPTQPDQPALATGGAR